MKAYKVTQAQMESVLTEVNRKYDGNVKWKRFEPNGSGVHFTLTVNNSKAKGSRKSYEGRRIAAACWHVHGDFFDALFEIAPESYVRSMGRRIDVNGGNWEDRNIGSQMYPMMHSESCDC